MLTRRQIVLGVLAIGVAGGPVAVAASDIDHENIDALAPIDLRLSWGGALISWVVIRGGEGVVALNVTQPSLRYNENRVQNRFDTGRIPLLGDLFRPSLSQRFAGARAVGSLRVDGRQLTLGQTAGEDLSGKRLVIANGEQSWEPAGRTLRVAPGRLLPQHRAGNGREVGQAYLKGDELLLLVRPAVVEPPAA